MQSDLQNPDPNDVQFKKIFVFAIKLAEKEQH